MMGFDENNDFSEDYDHTQESEQQEDTSSVSDEITEEENINYRYGTRPEEECRQNNNDDYIVHTDEHTKKSRRKNHKGLKTAAVFLLIAGLAGAGGTAAWKLTGTIKDLKAQIADLQESSASATQSIPQISTGTRVESTGSEDVSDIVEAALPSVVAITNKSVVTNNTWGYWGSSQQYEQVGSGSGIIIGDNGEELWIVTNHHVIEDAKSLTATFCDGETVDVYLKGSKSDNDLAVVGVALSDLKESTRQAIKAITLGDSDSLRMGQKVIAIGNALGFGQSVTDGVVSALDRTVTFQDGTSLNLLQTSAAINPGNSGGALLNMNGELIGINSAKYSETDVEGIGFAIPISSVKDIIQELSLMQPKVAVSEENYPYLGISFKQVSSSMMQSSGMPEGALVYSVGEGTPAEEAGVLSWDIITGLDDEKISSFDDLTDQLQYYSGGTTVKLTIQRVENGKYVEKQLDLTLGYKKDFQQ